MARAAVMITYAELFGKEPRGEDLEKILARYRRIEVVALLGKINCMLGTWKNEPDFELDARLCKLMLPSHADQLETFRKGSTDQRIVFSRLALLYTIKQAFLHSKPDGKMPQGPLALEEIGIAVLMANDLVLPAPRFKANSTLEKLTNLLPFTDYVSHDEYTSDIARTFLMFEEMTAIPEVRQAAEFIDLSEIFTRQIGVTLREFCDMLFACATRYLNPKPGELLASPDALIVRPEFFQKTNIPPEKVQAFLSKVSVDEGRYCEEMERQRERPGDDLTIFQKFPFIQVLKDVHICLDPGFLVEKAGRGLYWTLFSELLNGNERTRLAAFWGRLFEEYINGILTNSYRAGGRFISQPRFTNGDQAFDACILENRDLFVFEHKSSVLRADCKYSGNAAKLGEDLNLKFIEGDAEGRKGLRQLKHSLGRFFAGEHLEGIRPDDIARVFPSLVCLDRSLAVPFMGKYLDEEFRKDFPPSSVRQTVTPLLTLSVTDVENVAPYLHKLELSRIFESFYANNKGQLWSMSNSHVPILKRAKKGRDLTRERFDEFVRLMESDLFGTGDENKEDVRE